nr:multicopper oxidase domain-containing protein [Paenibacillus agricola]
MNQGDYVKITLKNQLSENTSIHWHGLIVPNRMDGFPGPGGSPVIRPGESFTYEFYVHQSGTLMYHSHVNTAVQEIIGLSGMFISRGVFDESLQRDMYCFYKNGPLRWIQTAGCQQVIK